MRHPVMVNLLSAQGPLPEYQDKLMAYGQFVGSWDIEATYYDRGKVKKKLAGEWYFGWILGGLGVQDVLSAFGAEAHCRGTTLRCYDSAADAWHICWMQPAIKEFVNMLGRRVGDRIIQEELAPGQRRLRWSFNDIAPDSFLWLGEVSTDGGATWELEEEMYARRRTV